ncbi:MAG: hypothetical protein WKF86_02975 [Acidimicrobiales bacterium]
MTMTRTITLHGARGGQGTTTVAAALALFAADAGPTTLVCDDPTATCALLGVPAPLGDDWARVTPTLRLDPSGPRPASQGVDATVVVDGGRLPEANAGDPTVAPVGKIEPLPGKHYAVLRGPCYIALASPSLGPRIDGVVLVAEDGRSLSAADVHDVLGVPVVAPVPTPPAVGRPLDPRRLTSPRDRRPQLRPLRTLALPPDRAQNGTPTEDTDLPLPKIGNERCPISRRRAPSQGVWERWSAEHRTPEPGSGRLLPRGDRQLRRGLLHRTG